MMPVSADCFGLFGALFCSVYSQSSIVCDVIFCCVRHCIWKVWGGYFTIKFHLYGRFYVFDVDSMNRRFASQMMWLQSGSAKVHERDSARRACDGIGMLAGGAEGSKVKSMHAHTRTGKEFYWFRFHCGGVWWRCRTETHIVSQFCRLCCRMKIFVKCQ